MGKVKSMKARKRKKIAGNISGILMLIQLLSSILFGAIFMITGIFPITYLMVLIIVLVILVAVPLALQRTLAARIGAILYSMVISGVLLLGSLYLWQANKMLDDITIESAETGTQLEDVAIIVLAEDPAQSINDTANYIYGIQTMMDRDNTDITLQSIEENLGSAISIMEYDSLLDQVEALYNQEIGAMIMNEKFRSLIEDTYEDFSTETRVVSSYQYEKEEEPEKEKVEHEMPESEAFCVFLSGIDTYGGINAVSRSDVNIIAAVNPETKQILLLTTPRDYYVEFPFYEGCMDKLTHAGIYGVETSMETLGNLYGVNVDYYARINFTGFETLVNSLGGVEVYSQYAFTSRIGGYAFNEGYNYVDGAKALAFVRERKSFGTGDIQRGKNQMEMIKAITNKIISPSILANYSSFMSSISSFVTTNMSKDMISDLVKDQLSGGGSWNIVSYNVSGSGTNAATYSMGSRAVYVMIPDEATVDTAKELLRQVYAGETLTPVQ